MTSVLVWTTATSPPAPPAPVDERPYVRCQVCHYERPIGEPCGLPCV